MTEFKQLTIRAVMFKVLEPRATSAEDDTPRNECLLWVINHLPVPDANGIGLNNDLKSKAIIVPGGNAAEHAEKYPKGAKIVAVVEYRERDEEGKTPLFIAREVLPDDGRPAIEELKDWYGEGEWEKVMATSI